MTEKPSRGFTKGKSGNPRGRPAGSERLRKELMTHEPEIIAAAVERAVTGSDALLIELLNRLHGRYKPVCPPVGIPGAPGATSVIERADLVIAATLAGDISADIAERFMSVLVARAKLEEHTELAERIAKLEETIHAKGFA